MEVWQTIPDFPGYDVSDQGRVRSFWRIVGLGRGKGIKQLLADQPQRILRLDKSRNRPKISLYKEGRRCHCFVHRLILLAFVSPCPPDMESCHNDGNTTHNALDNLRWDTSANNGLDKRRHGTAKGSKNPSAKLTDEQVIRIRKKAEQGWPQKELAQMFNVSIGRINKIVNRTTWTHL